MKLRPSTLRELAWALPAAVSILSMAPAAQAAPRRTFAVQPASGAIRVDGVLDEEAWALATVIDLPYEWYPGDNTVPPEKTECLVTFDAERLYVAFRASDRDPSRIRAHMADRDTAFQDDTVGFMIDPFNDERRAFQFRVNALGVQMDASSNDVDGSDDWSWDAIWESRGRTGEDGYVVEVAVPFSSLRFPRSALGQTWGFAATRDLPRSLRHRLRSTWTDRNTACLVCQFDKITGLQGMRRGRNLELDPTLTALRTDTRSEAPDGPLRPGDVDPQPGLSARWGLTPSLALGAAVNPDFSQVEADVAQLDVNTRFALFYAEKRPLFLEGADLFSTPMQAVFTRTIADPDWGVKLTGKEGRSALGAYVVRDSVNNLLFPSNQGSALGSLDQASWSGVFRYRRDVGRGSNLGLLYTARMATGYHNHLGGIDGRWRPNDSDSARVQVLLSDTRYPRSIVDANGQPAGGFGGHAYFADYQHASRDWYWFARADGLSPGFRADNGFVTRVDARSVGGGVQRIVWGRGGQWFTRLDGSVYFKRTHDWSGALSDWSVGFPVSYYGPRQVIVTYNPVASYETFVGAGYHNLRHNFTLQTRPWGSLSFSLTGSGGETIDVANAAPASTVSLRPRIEFSLARGLNGSLQHSVERLQRPGGARLFTANLTELRLVWHLDLRTFVRGILQYTNLDRVPSAYRVPVTAGYRRLFSQYLFSYKLNPQTVLLLGYSDNQDGPLDAVLRQTDRTLFFKIGYAWVL